MYFVKKLDMSEITAVYNEHMKFDFPPDELKPLSIITGLIKKENYICYGIYEKENICGYACFATASINDEICCLLDYFAVVRGMRNKGTGSQFLNLLKDFLTQYSLVICEVENPDYSTGDERVIRNKRIDFYLRNGFIKTDLTAKVFGVDYNLLVYNSDKNHSNDEIKLSYRKIYTNFLSRLDGVFQCG